MGRRKGNEDILDNIRSLRISILENDRRVDVLMETSSRTREGVVHTTHVICGAKGCKKSCSCEGFTFRQDCIHVKVAEYLAKKEYEELLHELEGNQII